MKVNACNSDSGLSRRMIFIERKVETCHGGHVGGAVSCLSSLFYCGKCFDPIGCAIFAKPSDSVLDSESDGDPFRCLCRTSFMAKPTPNLGFQRFGPSSVSFYY
jgi:hypothetical protein